LKRTSWILLALTLGLLALSQAGCKKQTVSESPQTLAEGVAQLRAALSTASPEVQSNLYSGVSYNIRYGYYAEALAALGQITGSPGLSDQQKKMANDVAELLKKAIQDQQNAPKAAQ
jgi:hypothetical protein